MAPTCPLTREPCMGRACPMAVSLWAVTARGRVRRWYCSWAVMASDSQYGPQALDEKEKEDGKDGR